MKYADLKTSRQMNYIFSFDRMLDMKGNTAVYLLYAYARIQSIFRRAGVEVDSVRDVQPSLEHDSEVALALQMLQFHQEIEYFLRDLMPHRFCEFLYDLSSKFSDFFRDCKVVGDPKQVQRKIYSHVHR